MAVTDHANAAAAVTAGYKKVQIDRGTPGPNDKNPAPRFATVFSKPITGASGGSGDGGRQLEVMGESTVDAATADTNALAALNATRRHYYGGSPGRASGQAESQSGRGGSHTADTT